MTILNYAKQQTALFLGGSQLNYPTYMMIGSGSGTVSLSQDALIAATDRQAVTSTTNSLYKISWQGDWSSSEISGTQLREFGMTGSASTITGSMWSRINFPAITFDGTNELRIIENWEVF